MVAAWAAVWLMLAVLDGRWLRAPAVRPWSEILTRGIIAAVLGGLAFYLVLDVLWGHDREANKNYLVAVRRVGYCVERQGCWRSRQVKGHRSKVKGKFGG